MGKVAVKNAGKEPITNVSLTFVIKQYMDGPKECPSIAELKPGETRELPLYALFNSSILDVTEATKATSEVFAAYTEAGEKQSQNKTATVRIYNRNAMTWDDDRKAAAFVSGKDPWVLDFANNVTAMVKDQLNPTISKNLQMAIAFHNALRVYGLSYTPNPTTPYSQTSTNPEIVDFLRFPRQTLMGKAGDCSDLSILYSSFFESIGVECAFITVPGHIFMAINLGMTPEEANANVANHGDLIIQDGKVWLPIEATLRDQGLLDAWAEGAREWKKCSEDKTAAFYPIHEAWKLYEPVGLAADDTAVRVPGSDLVTQTFAAELSKYLQQEISVRVSVLNDAMKKTGETAQGLNSRGVVYAKYGRLDLAEKDFQAAIKKKPNSVPALLNLGNLAWLKPDAQAAYTLYQKAAKVQPNNAKVLISLAMAARSLGKDKDAAVAFEAAAKADPELAAKYSFIAEKGSSGTRAAEVNTKAVLWDEE
jgi:tetratricopeptide (TPR) repeat protein